MSIKNVTITELTPKNYKDFLMGNELILVDFYAEWCPPCLQQGELLADEGYKLVEKYHQLKLVKMNTDNDEGISNYLSIKKIPNLVVCYKRFLLKMTEGLKNIEDIEGFIGKVIEFIQKNKANENNESLVFLTPEKEKKKKAK